MSAAVSIQSISKYLGNNLILNDISLEIPAGETTAILGESGCGKTTLLHHINGLLIPDEGAIEISGQPIDYARLTELRRRMGYAVQSVGLFPHLTVTENLALLARLSGWTADRIDARSARLMQLLQLPKNLADRFPHELSGGQKQRVGICRAMMLGPDLLLLDEPFSGVDPITRFQIHEEFKTLMQTEPATTILVTHDVGEAIRLASRLVVMEHGRISQKGKTDRVLAQPESESVARLFRNHAP